MEGEPDRGEDGDSREGATDGLGDYRDELRKRHPDSGDHDQEEARHGIGASEQHDSASTTKVADEASEAGRRLEHANSSTDAEGRPEPDARLRSDSSDGKERAAEHPERSAEFEGQNELERLREDLREKYPEWEASHGVKPEELKESRAAVESENLGRDAKQATPSQAENQERGAPTDAGRSKAGPESDSSSESYAGEDARPELEQLRKEINEKEKGLGDTGEATPRKEDSISASSLEKDAEDKERGKTVVSGSEIRDSGGKIDSAQTDSESSVWSEKSAREAGFDVHEQASSANADRSRALENPAVNMIPDSKSETEGKEVGKISDEEHASRKEIKAAVEDSGGDSRAIGEGQTPLAKEAGTGLDRSSKSGKELADLEKIGASDKEQVNSRGKESHALRSPRASYPESSRQEKLDRADAIPVNANRHQSKPPVICFDIPKQAIEEKTGVRMEEEKLYHFKGSVVGKYDFEMYRTASSYIRHFVPVEHHHQIQPGKVHDISIASVKEVLLTKAQSKLVSEWRDRGVPWNRIAYRINHMKPEAAEQQIQPLQHSGVGEKKKLHQLEKLERVENIGATFVAVARFHGKDKANHEDRFYFRIDNSEYKQKTGMAIEEGATYKIKGEIEGVGPFEKKLRSVASGQNMPIYVPRELNSRVELGRQYKITINSVERIPSIRDSWDKLERPSNEWTWKEIASWIDTEGRINSEGGYYADIAQKDKRVIQEICGFYDDQGLHPMMILDKSMGGWHAHLHRVDDVAMVIKNIERHIRTENKKEQIQLFKESLREPRKKLHGGIMKARKFLELE